MIASDFATFLIGNIANGVSRTIMRILERVGAMDHNAFRTILIAGQFLEFTFSSVNIEGVCTMKCFRNIWTYTKSVSNFRISRAGAAKVMANRAIKTSRNFIFCVFFKWWLLKCSNRFGYRCEFGEPFYTN